VNRFRNLLTLLTATSVAVGLSSGSAGAADEFDKFALQSAGASLSSTQAGAHADLTTTFELTRDSGGVPFAKARDIDIALPPGMIGNPQAVPRCTTEQLGSLPEDSECPVATQVGITAVRVIDPVIGTFVEPIYNMEPPKNSDIVARFGFIAAAYPTFVNLRVDPTDYSIVASVEGAPSAAGLLEARTTIWGVPADPSHDDLRLTPLEARQGEFPPGGRPAGLPPAPFLSNPTDCGLERELTITARSYQLPDQPSTMSAPFPDITGCGSLEFAPTFTIQPTNPEAAAPSGIDSELTIPQNESPQGRATSVMRSARVSLPEGFTINAAAGDGLEACSSEQVGYGQRAASHCPDAAKIGSVEIEVPALEDTLRGGVYQRTPEPGNLFRFWVVTDEQGVHLKLPAQIELDKATGRVSTVFSGIDTLGGLPQVPFSSLRLHIFGGPRAPIATPPACGTYQSRYELTPWSGKAPTVGEAPMQITTGCGKGGFAPEISAGMRSLRAGSFSPFTFTLTRKDGEANPASLEVHLPLGLTARLAGVPLCPEAQAQAGACGPESKIGSLTVATGVGGAPLWVPQPGKAPTAIYLSGPYKGAPYSIVSVVPAQAGPFDLGLVVNRAAIHVDPVSAAVTLETDPLPQILEGVPATYRTINATVDRPGFMLNPTSCAPKQVSATVTAATGQVAEPTDGFQATNCAKLPYRPALQLRLKGGTRRSANPALTAILRPHPGEANSRRVSVALPHSEFLDQSHIRTICTRVQFNAGAGNGAECPAASVYGAVRAWTPLLAEPLAGEVYLRSSDHPLPDLVLALHGPLEFTAVGRIDSKDGGIRNTFEGLPDAPITKVVVSFQGGKKGLLENSTDLCAGAAHRAAVQYLAHSGRPYRAGVPLRAQCGKGKKKKHAERPRRR